MATSEERRLARLKRHRRVRKRVYGTDGCPRLSIFRSAKHIYAQIIDDTKGRTLASTSTLEKEIKEGIKGLKKTEQARIVGQALAVRALTVGVKRVVFDRGGYRYHGRVKALAEGSRSGGLEF